MRLTADILSLRFLCKIGWGDIFEKTNLPFLPPIAVLYTLIVVNYVVGKMLKNTIRDTFIGTV